MGVYVGTRARLPRIRGDGFLGWEGVNMINPQRIGKRGALSVHVEVFGKHECHV